MARKRVEPANEELAALIAQDLVSRGLVPPGERDKVQEKLVAGTARASDWRLWISKAVGTAGGDSHV